MGTCGECGAELTPDARFCPSCGAGVNLLCVACGSPLEAGAAFCSHCGHRVGDPARPAARPALTTQPRQSERGEERKLVTILFADVAGSTSLAEHLDPEQLREVMERYFDAMREEIEAEGGTVEKFIGDAVMAAFGVPTAHEDDPSRALRAADAMGRRLASVNAGLAQTHGLTLDMRIGVNTGEVLASTRPEPGAAMATGDAVNVAARLQTAAEPGDVLVSERTARAARGFAFDARRTLDLRGRREPVRAFKLTGQVGGPTRGVPYLTAPMVGRDAELDVLDSIYSRTADEGRPHIVTVYGDPGVGKSRLVREFLDSLQDREPAPLVLQGRCLPYGDGVTYWPLAEMLKSFACIDDQDSAEQALAKIKDVTAKLDGLVEVGAGDAQHTASLLAYTMGLADPHQELALLDPPEVRRQVHLAWRSFFSSLAVSGPVVLAVEDIHWADSALLDLLDELGDRTYGPVLFVFPARPDLVATRPAWGGGRRNAMAVSIAPLPPSEAAHLVELLLTIEDLPPSVHQQILDKAEGNPFFLEEILRRLIDEGAVFRDQDRWRASPGIEAIQLPDSVQAVLASRIDLLSAEDKRVLQAAAVVGRVFWAEPLRLLTAYQVGDPPGGARQTRQALEDSLRRLEDRELVSPRVGSAFAGQPEYIFKHILTRDVAYESIPRRDRAVAHAETARWLERSAGERVGEFGELLAYHFHTAVTLADQAGAEQDPALVTAAMGWLLRASADALHKHVIHKAELLAQDALELATSPVEMCTALTALGLAYLADSKGDLAWRYLREAAACADDSPEVSDLETARLLGLACDMPLRWPGTMTYAVPEPEVRALRDRGLALAGTADSRERANLLSISASWPFAYPDDVTEPMEHYVRLGMEGYEVAMRVGDYNLASGSLDAASSAHGAMGDYRSSMEIWRLRWELRDRLTRELEVVDLYGMGAWECWELGDYQEGLKYAEAIMDQINNNGVLHAAAWGMVSLYRLGRWDEALALFERSRVVLGTRRDSPPAYASHMFAAAAIVAEVREERLVADALTTALATVSEAGVRPYGWRILIALQRGERDRAKELLASPPPAWPIHASVAWEARCEAVMAFGEWDRGAALSVEVRQYAEPCGIGHLLPTADRLAGVTAAAQGQLDESVRLLTRAVSDFDVLEVVWDAARTRRMLAAVLTLAGRPEEAARVEALAQQQLRQLGVVKDRVTDAVLDALGSQAAYPGVP
jgi:class 3 adenylate cyclase/tetratricopeptide (TPR) repeat protein